MSEVGTKVLKVCKEHSDCIIYHNNNIPCPLCYTLNRLDDIQGDLDSLEEKYEFVRGEIRVR